MEGRRFGGLRVDLKRVLGGSLPSRVSSRGLVGGPKGALSHALSRSALGKLKTL